MALLASACQKPKSKSITGNSPISSQDSTLMVVEEKWTAEPTNPKKQEVDWIKVQPLEFESLKIRSKVEFSSPTTSQDFPVNFQIRKDSLIWVSVSVGLEVGRGIISRDSIILVDRLNKHVYQLDFQTLSNQFGFPLSFHLIQSMILGESVFPQREQDLVVRQADVVQLSQEEGPLWIESWFDLIRNKLTQVQGKHKETSQTIEIRYPTFQETIKGFFPTQVLVKVEDPEKKTNQTRIFIEHQKVEFVSRDLRFPFNVPKNYTEKPLKL